ncbi:MAG: 2-amino-4-hydroxy-6-hydroxymethyldihydropteridine diphosphokinase [Phycisphaerae bacterium]|nr:2-amino-4-hydroxy-6-hydroxymethyldihydropteridine diphosphokinase [Phycisphaerae bacterium]
MTEHTAYIGLGNNVEDCERNLHTALSGLDGHPKISVIKTSSFYTTPPLGSQVQPDFLNAVTQVHTSLSCGELFQALNLIEQDMGRKRDIHWGPRIIDLDLLLYAEMIVDDPDLKVPHPQMHLRSFVLKGMCELADDFVHPQLGRTMRQLYQRLNGRDFFSDPQKPQLISIAGNIGVGKTTLSDGLAGRLGAQFITEKYDENPFLADVYAGHTELALDSELFFLSSSASQLRKKQLKAGKRYVSDYVFDKALIYASGWLNETDLQAYQKHYDSVFEGVFDPVLVIYLHDSVENCLQRIHQRNRPYEQKIEASFLEHLAAGYETLYTDYPVCPVMRLRPDQCVDAEQVDRIAKEVQFYLAKTD